MSVDPNSFNFDTGLSNINLDTSAASSLGSSYNPSGQLTEADLIGGGQSGVGGYQTVPNLAPVTANSYNLDSSQVLDSLNGQNPFAGANGGAPLDSSYTPAMQPITGSAVAGLDSNLASELSLNMPQQTAPASNPGSTFSGSNLLGDAALMGLGYYGISQAKQAQAQTNQEVQPLFNESQTMLGESKSLLDQYNSGTLPSWAQSQFNELNNQGQNLVNNYNQGKLPGPEQKQADTLNNMAGTLYNNYKNNVLPQYAQTYVDWTSQEASNLINASPTQALTQIATQNFTDYSSGQLKPADEIQLDQQTKAQKQAVASMMAASGNVDSSVLQAQYQQIDSQAQVQRQQILNGYFQTGDKAYNDWVATNMDAAQVKAAGANFANNVFSTMLQDALQTQEFTANYTAQGLEAELQAGSQMEVAATNFEGQTFNNMLNGAFQGATIGNQALTQAIGIQLQSDENLSKTVGDLMSSIASAFTYSAYQHANGGYGGGGGGYGGGGGGGAGGPSTLSAIVGGVEQYGGLVDRAFSAAGGGAAAANIGRALGAAGAAYSVYNFAKNWQSGATGSEAAQGAEAGASVGMLFGPIGGAVGAVIGGAVGAISSAFGGGRNDPETLNWDNLAPQLSQNPAIANTMTPSQVYQSLAGIMDAKDNSPGHSTNLELKFGRMGEGSLMTAITDKINEAVQHQANPNDSPEWLYSNVVKPYLQQIGAYVNSNDIVTKNGTQAGGSIDALLTRAIGLWQSGNLTSSTPVGVNGQTIQGLQPYGA